MPRLVSLLASLLIGSFLLPAPVHAGSSRPKTTFRVYVQTKTEGLSANLAFPVVLRNPDEVIYVKNPPELSERDIATVSFADADMGKAMRVILTERARDILRNVTLEHRGLILVIFLNGRVVYAPVIDHVISNGTLIIPRGIHPQEQKLIEEDLRRLRKERRGR